MSEQQGIIAGLPYWGKLTLFASLILLMSISLAFGFGLAIWVLGGPLILFEMWRSERFGRYARNGRPWLFWICFAILGAMTAIGGFDFYQRVQDLTL